GLRGRGLIRATVPQTNERPASMAGLSVWASFGLELIRPLAQPAVDQRLFVAQVVAARGVAAVGHETRVAQLARALADRLAIRIEQTEVQVDARRVDVLDDAHLAQRAAAPGFEVAGAVRCARCA